MKRITMEDVAQKAGVSKSTISQYVNGRFHYMATDTKEKIEEAIKQLNYRPNALAQGLRQRKSKTIAVIVANILHAFSTEVIRAIEDTCHEQGVHVIVCNTDNDVVKEKNYLEMLYAKQVDGFIVFPTNKNVQLLAAYAEEGFPLVFVDRILEQVSVNTVLVDNNEMIRIAVRALVAKGKSKIVLMLPEMNDPITPRIERREAFESMIMELGLSEQENQMIAVPIDKIPSELKAILNGKNRPDSIIAGNDFVLKKTLHCLQELAVQVPEELALVGLDDVPFASFMKPAITTVAQPTYAIGKKAATLLLEGIADDSRLEEYSIYRFKPIFKGRNSI
ncbi:LacI family kdg operon repressor [Alkalihalobacillus xiaoxiensis]|uniref:LacI family kdg operon repressor n=1 Tax=Shouchella xiaoxiensis TaxID=766895 RepID=A0ABS2SYE2_9BACI|nr:LacI family kdg operon repressor [Shouchella xiaoxiensis]